jgi:outer membrane protein assembly factor BamB
MTTRAHVGVVLAGAALAAACNQGASRGQPVPPAVVVQLDNQAPSSGPSSSPDAGASPVAAPAGPAPTWDWRGPKAQGFIGYTRPVELATKGGTCRFTYRDAVRSTSIECFGESDPARLWGYDEGGGFVEDAALAADESTLYVVRYCDISSGAVAAAYDLERGTPKWRTALFALGPVAHSEYSNRVQVSVVGGKVRVLGDEAAGRYIEDLDLQTGATTANWSVDEHGRASAGRWAPAGVAPSVAHPGAADGVAFAFPGGAPTLPAQDLSIRAGSVKCVYSFDRGRDRVHFACTDPQSKRLWGFDLAKQFVASAALASDATRVYVAQLCGIATGTTVTAFDASTGRQEWRDDLYGVGPVSHSKYSNEVSLRVEGGHVVVSGWESAGKYVEVIDARSGADLGNRRER